MSLLVVAVRCPVGVIRLDVFVCINRTFDRPISTNRGLRAHERASHGFPLLVRLPAGPLRSRYSLIVFWMSPLQ